jgi:hypothetical protein
LRIEARVTLATTIDAGFQWGVDHAILFLPTHGWDAQERVTRKTIAAIIILDTLNALALKAHADARFWALRAVGQIYVLR